MLEISRPALLPLSMDLRFLLCERTSLRARVYSRRTCLHSQIRRAHNLSDRFRTLEKDIRPRRQIPKGGIAGVTPVEETLDISQSPTKSAEAASETIEMEVLNKGGRKSILRPKPRTFKGVLIPLKPPPPASDECCMSSCTVCVYDLYASALEDYDEALTRARSELSAREISPVEWPVEVLTESDRNKREQARSTEGGVDAGRRIGITGESDHERQMAVIIGAFVKFEQALKEKRKAQRVAQLHPETHPPTSISQSSSLP